MGGEGSSRGGGSSPCKPAAPRCITVRDGGGLSLSWTRLCPWTGTLGVRRHRSRFPLRSNATSSALWPVSFSWAGVGAPRQEGGRSLPGRVAFGVSVRSMTGVRGDDLSAPRSASCASQSAKGLYAGTGEASGPSSRAQKASRAACGDTSVRALVERVSKSSTRVDLLSVVGMS